MNQNTIAQMAKRRVVYFVMALSLFTVGATFLVLQSKGSPIAFLVMMWTPALAAILISFFTRRSFNAIGWSVKPVRWLALAWLIPILYGLAAYVPLWISGLGAMPNPVFLERARLTLNMPEASNGLIIVAAFFFITLVNLLPSMLFSLGEELGWRGFLVPELTRWIGLRKAGLLSGVIWAVWHLPGILFGDYRAMGTPLAFQLICFLVMVVSGSMLFAWLRMRSGSVWPAVILHAVHNNVIQSFFDHITANTGYTQYFAGEFGIMLALVMALIGWVVWKQLGKLEQAQREIPEAALSAAI